jgi:hypothetical protein
MWLSGEGEERRKSGERDENAREWIMCEESDKGLRTPFSSSSSS